MNYVLRQISLDVASWVAWSRVAGQKFTAASSGLGDAAVIVVVDGRWNVGATRMECASVIQDRGGNWLGGVLRGLAPEMGL